MELVAQAQKRYIAFQAAVADSFYGEDRGFRKGLADLKVGYVLALKPSFTWWHRVGDTGSLQGAARATSWLSPQRSGLWQAIERTFRDGHTETWWALDVDTGPFGPQRAVRAVVVTTDPLALPTLTTWYLITNLMTTSLPEMVRLYGLRMWVEQSYKQVKTTLGWAQYQVCSDTAIRRHWALVSCAFTFCWWQASESRLLPEPADCHACFIGTDTPKTPAPTCTSSVLASGPTSGQSLA